MHAWEQIQKTVDYIEDHIGEIISVEELAEIACLSPFYFQRLFHRLVKCPVAEYIKLRRIALAKEALHNSKRKVLDIALSYGFSTHEHFSRTFKNTFGISPTEYRKAPKWLNSMTKPDLLLQYVLIDEGVPLITDQIVLEIQKKKITKATQYAGYVIRMPISYGEGLGVESGEDPMADLWDGLHLEKEQGKIFNPDSEEIGLVLSDEEEGYYRYFAGTRPYIQSSNMMQDLSKPEWSASQKEVRPFTFELPIGEYIVCSFEAENFECLVMDVLYKATKYTAGIWIPKHKLEVEPFCVEYYETHTPDTNKMEIWMKIRNDKE